MYRNMEPAPGMQIHSFPKVPHAQAQDTTTTQSINTLITKRGSQPLTTNPTGINSSFDSDAIAKSRVNVLIKKEVVADKAQLKPQNVKTMELRPNAPHGGYRTIKTDTRNKNLRSTLDQHNTSAGSLLLSDQQQKSDLNITDISKSVLITE